jgi:hypothetical protein
VLVLGQIVGQLGQAPARERTPQPSWVGLGGAADLLTHHRADPRHRPTVSFWVQRRKPPIVEPCDHIPHGLFLRSEHHRDLPSRPALQRRQHHPRPPQPHPIPRRPRHPDQPLRLPRIQLPNKHLRPTRHHRPPPTASIKHDTNPSQADPPITSPHQLDAALGPEAHHGSVTAYSPALALESFLVV